MFKKFFPHRWLGLRALRFIVLGIFYVAFAVGLYSLVSLLGTFLPTPPTGPRNLYIAACLQAILVCAAAGALSHLLHGLQQLEKQVCQKEAAKK